MYTAALSAAGVTHQVWDLGDDLNIPLNYMKAFRNIVWFTGNSWPQPLRTERGEADRLLGRG